MPTAGANPAASVLYRTDHSLESEPDVEAALIQIFQLVKTPDQIQLRNHDEVLTTVADRRVRFIRPAVAAQITRSGGEMLESPTRIPNLALMQQLYAAAIASYTTLRSSPVSTVGGRDRVAERAKQHVRREKIPAAAARPRRGSPQSRTLQIHRRNGARLSNILELRIVAESG